MKFPFAANATLPIIGKLLDFSCPFLTGNEQSK